MRRLIPLLLIGGAILLSAAVYGSLPERLPTHWNIRGEIDGWMSRPWWAFLLPAIALGVWALLSWLPSIDPRRENYQHFRGAYDFLVAAVVGFLAVIHAMILGVALELPIPFARLLPVAIGLLLIAVCGALPRSRPNWFFGIRTPWTLSNDVVWERTHHVGGIMMITTGIVIAISAALQPQYSFWLIVLASLSMALTMVVYSYVVWRQEKREGAP